MSRALPPPTSLRLVNDEPAIALDPAALQRLRELDPGGRGRLLERVLEAFESSSTRLAAQLVEARECDDTAGIRLVVHTLKSSSASIGALLLARLCAEIEASLRDGMHADLAGRLDAVLHELRLVLQIVKPMLKGTPPP